MSIRERIDKVVPMFLVALLTFVSIFNVPMVEVQASGQGVATKAVKTKTFKSFNTPSNLKKGDHHFEGSAGVQSPSLGYLMRQNPKTGAVGPVLVKYKEDLNGTLAYCLNYDLESPNTGKGTQYVKSDSKLTRKEYTALMYGYGYPNDITKSKLGITNKGERYYVTQIALYALSNNGNNGEITPSGLKAYAGQLPISEASTKRVLKATQDYIKHVEANLMTLPKEEKISVTIQGNASKLKQNGNVLETGELKVVNSNSKGTLKLDKSNLGKGYFVDLNGKKVNDKHVLDGKAFKIQVDATDITKAGNVGFGVEGEVEYRNVYKYVPASGAKGVYGGKAQDIAWTDMNTNKDSATFQAPYDNVTGKIELTKVDTDGKLLDGATFELQKDGKTVATSTTKNGKIVFNNVMNGTYDLVETKAPEGYKITNKTTKVKVENASKTTKVTIENGKILGDLEITKKDVDEGKLLEGAEFVIKDSSGKEVAKGVTDKNGKALFKNLPYGKYTYQETKAPANYVLDKTVRNFEITKDGVTLKEEVTNEHQKGKMEIIKKDKETGKPVAGTEFVIKNTDGKQVAKGVTNKDGKAVFPNLKVGKYTYQETKASEGYLLDNPDPISFEVKSNGELVTAEVKNTPIKGNLELTKLRKGSEKGLANAEFVIKDSSGKEVATGKTNKEGKAVFKDLKYGKYTYQETKAPEGYVLDAKPVNFEITKNGVTIKETFENTPIEGNLEITKKDVSNGELLDGAKFVIKDSNGKEVATGVTKDGKATFKNLEYGKYTYQEVEAPTGYLLEDTVRDFEIKDNGKAVSIEVTNKPNEIKTSASFVERDVKQPNIVTLEDIVYYDNLNVGTEYEVKGKLMDKATGKPVVIDGKEVTGQTKFTPKKSKGEVVVTFTFDASKLEHDTVVVFEDLYDGKDLVAVHHDIEDKDQTVEIPDIGTTASFVERDTENTNKIVLDDIVKYKNLNAGKEYTVKGKLMQKVVEVDEDGNETVTEKPVLIDGEEVVSEKTFTPEKRNGEVRIEFVIEDTTQLETDKVVVFEDVYEGDKLFAFHHDIEDEAQTVEIPSVKTSAHFHERSQEDTNIVTLTDVVYYNNLLVGKEYTVSGKLMNKETGEPVIIDDEEVTGTTTFTAEESKGEVEVNFTFDQSKLETESVVVFEDLHQGEILVAVHHDINDEEQTVDMPKVKTSASFVKRDVKDTNIVTLEDVVTYENLVAGKEYTVKGKLMDKNTGEPVLIDEEEVLGETTFVAEERNGEVVVEFTFDQSKLETETVVVFEDVFEEDRLIAVHHDINDEEQTVDMPKVKTSASFVERDKKDTNMVTLDDVVTYENLVVGKEYTVTGKLMDKETGEPVLIDDKEVTGSTTFTAEERNGEVIVQFVFDASKLENDTVVVFEDIYDGENLIAVHHDIEDMEQTVTLPSVKTSASFVERDKDNKNMVTMKDIVYYDNLEVGKEYTVKGKLMDKHTGKEIKRWGKGITGETTFVAEEASGSVEVLFTFDQSKLKTDTVVVFEDLYQGDRLIAVHHDINDSAQTVELPPIPQDEVPLIPQTGMTSMTMLYTLVGLVLIGLGVVLFRRVRNTEQ